MAKRNPVTVYAVSAERAKTLEPEMEALGWCAVAGTEMLEILGQVVFYMPDLILLEDTPQSPLAQDAFFHLDSIKTRGILVLSDYPGRFVSEHGGPLRVLPHDTSDADVVRTMLEMTDDNITVR